MIKERIAKGYLVFSIFLAIFFSGSFFAQNDTTRFYYQDSSVHSVGVMLNGQPEGLWKTYFQAGTLKSKVNWKNGKLNGTSSFYVPEGILIKSIEYTNGLKNGYTTEFDSTGNKILELPYESDTLNGTGYRYYPSGILKEEFFYSNGKLDGTLRKYGEDGRLTGISRFEEDSLIQQTYINQLDENGRKQGFWETRDKAGNLLEEGKYRDGKRNGSFRKYDRYGRVSHLEEYLNGKLVEQQEFSSLRFKEKFHEESGLWSRGPEKNGLKIGTHHFYDSTGNRLFSEVYRDDTLTGRGIVSDAGIKDSMWLYFFPNGQKSSEGSYQQGQKTGKWIFYYPDGKKAQQGYYRDNLPHGSWVWYYSSGQVRAEENYYKGKLEGTQTEYDSLGKCITQGIYVGGAKDGDWFYYVGDHKEKGKYEMDYRQGEWIYYYNDEQIVFKGEFKDDKPVGKHKEWYGDGSLKSIKRYKPGGRKHGKWKLFYKDGSIEHTLYYKNGKLVNIDGKAVKKD